MMTVSLITTVSRWTMVFLTMTGDATGSVLSFAGVVTDWSFCRDVPWRVSTAVAAGLVSGFADVVTDWSFCRDAARRVSTTVVAGPSDSVAASSETNVVSAMTAATVSASSGALP